jgi:hypothetical protein
MILPSITALRLNVFLVCLSAMDLAGLIGMGSVAGFFVSE